MVGEEFIKLFSFVQALTTAQINIPQVLNYYEKCSPFKTSYQKRKAKSLEKKFQFSNLEEVKNQYIINLFDIDIYSKRQVERLEISKQLDVSGITYKTYSNTTKNCDACSLQTIMS